MLKKSHLLWLSVVLLIALIIFLSHLKVFKHFSPRELMPSHPKVSLSSQSSIPLYEHRVIQTFPHPKGNFTEGLVIKDNRLYESTGLYRKSKILIYDLPSFKVIKIHHLPEKYFGEGLTILGSSLYQLTYRSHVGFVYDVNTLKLKKKFHYSTEGWGLTQDGSHLIMSNGTSTLYFLDPVTFKTIKTLSVKANQHPLSFLNALAFIDNQIYANIWHTHWIAQISPQTGQVTGWIDLSLLNPKERGSEDVLNGIAYFPDDKTFLVTGKNWSRFYKIKILQSK